MEHHDYQPGFPNVSSTERGQVLSRRLTSMGSMPNERSAPAAGCAVRRRSEVERWSHRYHDAVDWALCLRDALEACREELEAAGSSYQPPAGWDLLLQLPEL